MSVKFMDILNENKSKLTEDEIKLLDHIKKDFEKKDKKEMEKWGGHIDYLDWAEYYGNYSFVKNFFPNMKSDGSKRTKMMRLLVSLINKGELIEVSNKSNQYSYTKKHNFGRDKGKDVTWSETEKMIKPKDWEW